MKQKLKLEEIKEQPTLLISKEIQNDIAVLHHSIGKVEWSGVLLYEIKEGTLSDLSNMVLEAKRIFLMNIGTSGGTSFDYGSECLDMYDMVSKSDTIIEGLVHTHHSMTTFFSGTDLSELEDNSGLYNMYLSLVVSFDTEYSAKLAIPAKKSFSSYTITNEKGKEIEMSIEKEEHIITADCKIKFLHDTSFIDRLKVIKDKKKEVDKIKPYTRTQVGYSNYNYDYNYPAYQPNYLKNNGKQYQMFSADKTVTDINDLIKRCVSLDPTFSGTLIEASKIHEKFSDIDDYTESLTQAFETNIKMEYPEADDSKIIEILKSIIDTVISLSEFQPKLEQISSIIENVCDDLIEECTIYIT